MILSFAKFNRVFKKKNQRVTSGAHISRKITSKCSPRAPKRRPKHPQETSRALQEQPRRLPGWPGSTPGDPKTTPGDPKTTPGAPQGPPRALSGRFWDPRGGSGVPPDRILAISDHVFTMLCPFCCSVFPARKIGTFALLPSYLLLFFHLLNPKSS